MKTAARWTLTLLATALIMTMGTTAHAAYPDPLPRDTPQQRMIEVVDGWRTLFPGSVDSWELGGGDVHIVYVRGAVLGSPNLQADLRAKLLHAGATSVRYSLVNIRYVDVESAAAQLGARYSALLSSGQLGVVIPTPGVTMRAVTVAGGSASVASVQREIGASYGGIPVRYQVGAQQLPAGADVYTTPGFHLLNGRQWRTSCEPYSRTVRCRTDILATTITASGGRYVQSTGWVFNNLTYAASPRPLWRGNPLGTKGSWVASDGRQWRTDCDSAVTGRNGCRSYVMASFIRHEAGRYVQATDWLFNNMVRFS